MVMSDRLLSPQALSGKSVGVFGNLDVPHTYTYIEDFVKGLVLPGWQDEALGEVLHIPNAETLTTRQFQKVCIRGIRNTVQSQCDAKGNGLYPGLVHAVYA